MNRDIRAVYPACWRSLAGALLLLLSGCASGYLINGKHVSDAELAKYRSAWNAEALSIAAASKVAEKEHRGILDLIATIEAQGLTDSPPCGELALTEVVLGEAATDYVRFSSGHLFGPLSFYEDWRVLACGRKHSWMVFVGPPPRAELQVVYATMLEDGWRRSTGPMKVKESSLKDSQ